MYVLKGIHSFSNCGKWKRLTGKSTKTSNIDIHHRRMSIFKETHIVNVAFAETASAKNAGLYLSREVKLIELGFMNLAVSANAPVRCGLL